jgi:two-component system OmpR family sensor kinase
MRGLTNVIGVLPTQRTVRGRLAFEFALVGTGLLLAWPAGVIIELLVTASDNNVIFIPALLAAGIGMAAVVLGQTACQITGNRRAVWLIPALALYSLDIVPDTALQTPVDGATTPGLGLLVDSVMLGLLLAAAIRPPARFASGTAWLAVGGCVVVGTTVESWLPVHVRIAPHSTVAAVLDLSVLFAWCLLAAVVVLVGFLTASPPLWRVGIGFAIIAVAHVLRRLQPVVVESGMLFSLLRMLGVLVVALGMAQLLRRALHTLLTERFMQQEELRLASLRSQEVVSAACEREHELRNGLSGLAGMARLLNGGPDDASRVRARTAALTELHRLSELLDRRDSRGEPELYSAAEVIEGLVALWRMNGMDIEASVDDPLMTVGRQKTLAQVLTNLLCNCARHAPGARVHVIGTPAGDRAVIQVRDDGYGAADGNSAGGGGLGLQICQRLLREEGGALTTRPPGYTGTGFTVTMKLRRLSTPATSLALDAGVVS